MKTKNLGSGGLVQAMSDAKQVYEKVQLLIYYLQGEMVKVSREISQ